MSVRGGTRFSGGANLSPSQIFKKRTDLINLDIPINSNATLLATVNIRETGTVYAVKLSLQGFAEGSLTVDAQRIMIYVRCVPEGTNLPDLTVENEIDTLNGFFVCLLLCTGVNQQAVSQYLNQKFRFRRKCDDNTDIQLIAQHTNTQGTGRVVNITGQMQVIVRVR